MIDAAAVTTMATTGASVLMLRNPMVLGRRPSSDSCESVREAPERGWMVPENMLNVMNQIAAPLARLPKIGAKVGPRSDARLPWSAVEPKTPSQTTGMTTK